MMAAIGLCLLLGVGTPWQYAYAQGSSQTTLTIQVPEIPEEEIEVPAGADSAADITLPEGWSWLDPGAQLRPGGYTELTAVYRNEEGEILREKVISVSCGVRIIEEQTHIAYRIGQDGGFVLVCDGIADEFQYLEIDGEEVPEAYYTIEGDFTLLSLAPEYMDTLSAGTHTAELFYTAGSTRWEFTVAEAENDAVETESDAVETESDSAETESDTAAETESDSAETESDGAETESDAAEAERDTAAETESDAAGTESDAAETESNAVKADSDAAKTGDETSAGLPIMGVLLSLALASGCVMTLGRREK